MSLNGYYPRLASYLFRNSTSNVCHLEFHATISRQTRYIKPGFNLLRSPSPISFTPLIWRKRPTYISLPIYPQNELSMVAQRFDLSNRSASPQKNDLVSFLLKVISFQNPSNLTISIGALSVHLERIWRSRNYHSIFCLLNFEWEGI